VARPVNAVIGFLMAGGVAGVAIALVGLSL
jgi:hypothetical protein